MTPLPIIRNKNGDVIVGICLSQQAHNHRELWEYANGNPAVRILEPNRTRMEPCAIRVNDYLVYLAQQAKPVYVGVNDEFGTFAVEVKQ